MHREVPAQPLGSEAVEAILLANMRGARSSRVAFSLGHPAQPKLLDGHSCECGAWIQWTVQICRSQQAMNRTVGDQSSGAGCRKWNDGAGCSVGEVRIDQACITTLQKRRGLSKGRKVFGERLLRAVADDQSGRRIFISMGTLCPSGRLAHWDNSFGFSLRILQRRPASEAAQAAIEWRVLLGGPQAKPLHHRQ